jgi:putative transcriptional regulator
VKKRDFDELIESVREAGKLRRGELTPSRTFEFQPDDVRSIRHDLGLSQSEFAMLIGVSVATLQNWEQGRRRPEGPARALLRIAATHPEAVLDALTVSQTGDG